EQLSHSSQPLVPERLFMAGGTNGENGSGHAAGQGLLGLLISLLVAEKSGFQLAESSGMSGLQDFAERMTKEAMESLQQAAMAAPTQASGPIPTAVLVESSEPAKSSKAAMK